MKEDVSQDDHIFRNRCLRLVRIKHSDAVGAGTATLDDVVAASEGVLSAFQGEGDVWQQVDVGAVFVDHDAVENAVQLLGESDDHVKGIGDADIHVVVLDEDVITLNGVQFHLEEFLLVDFVLPDNFEIVLVHPWNNHVASLRLFHEVEREALVLGTGLVQERVETADALIIRIIC